MNTCFFMSTLLFFEKKKSCLSWFQPYAKNGFTFINSDNGLEEMKIQTSCRTLLPTLNPTQIIKWQLERPFTAIMFEWTGYQVVTLSFHSQVSISVDVDDFYPKQ